MKVELQIGDTIAMPEGCKAIVKDGIVTIEKEFKDGDILVAGVNGERRNAFIYKSSDTLGFHLFYAGVNADGNLLINDSSNSRWGNQNLSHATDSEKQLLLDKMREQGLKWNAEEKRVEKIRWRAEDGKVYYYIDDQGITIVDRENGFYVDKNRHEYGNYFCTRAQAKEAAKRVKETLRKYHEEIGE